MMRTTCLVSFLFSKKKKKKKTIDLFRSLLITGIIKYHLIILGINLCIMIRNLIIGRQKIHHYDESSACLLSNL